MALVPLSVELGVFDVDGGHLGIGDDNAAGVLSRVEFTAHGEAGFGGGRDQLDYDPIAEEGLGVPVLAYEGEEAVLNLFHSLVPGGRCLTMMSRPSSFGQLLQFAYP
jgi:hypothetical protein